MDRPHEAWTFGPRNEASDNSRHSQQGNAGDQYQGLSRPHEVRLLSFHQEPQLPCFQQYRSLRSQQIRYSAARQFLQEMTRPDGIPRFPGHRPHPMGHPTNPSGGQARNLYPVQGTPRYPIDGQHMNRPPIYNHQQHQQHQHQQYQHQQQEYQHQAQNQQQEQQQQCHHDIKERDGNFVQNELQDKETLNTASGNEKEDAELMLQTDTGSQDIIKQKTYILEKDNQPFLGKITPFTGGILPSTEQKFYQNIIEVDHDPAIVKSNTNISEATGGEILGSSNNYMTVEDMKQNTNNKYFTLNNGIDIVEPCKGPSGRVKQDIAEFNSMQNKGVIDENKKGKVWQDANNNYVPTAEMKLNVHEMNIKISREAYKQQIDEQSHYQSIHPLDPNTVYTRVTQQPDSPEPQNNNTLKSRLLSIFSELTGKSSKTYDPYDLMEKGLWATPDKNNPTTLPIFTIESEI